MSPVLFNVYFSVIVNSLKKAALGCELYDKYIACIVYADDVILLSGSVVIIQKMLNICYDIGSKLDVVFNGKKSALFTVGKAFDVATDCLCIGHDSISWTRSLKYLGMFFTAGQKLESDINCLVRKFYTAANAIHSRNKYASEMSKLFLMKTFCLHLISYGCKCIYYDSKEIGKLNCML